MTSQTDRTTPPLSGTDANPVAGDALWSPRLGTETECIRSVIWVHADGASGQHAGCMAATRYRAYSQPRAAIVWGIGWFIAGQVLLSVILEWHRPELRDPEFGLKVKYLHERVQEQPNRPLCLVLGSSRAALGFCPDILTEEGPETLRASCVFNAAITGSGPVRELACLRRLLAEGLRPQHVIVEVIPPLLHQVPGRTELDAVSVPRLAWADLAHLEGRWSQPRSEVLHTWWASRLVPVHAHRFVLLSQIAPGWLPWSNRQDFWSEMQPDGWLPYPQELVTADEYRRKLAVSREEYTPRLAGFAITPLVDGCVRELLTLCREERIEVVLVLMPESSEFRSWYSCEAQELLDQYLGRLRDDYSIKLVNAREWIPDTGFSDGHHLLPHAAATFSKRFAQEARLLQGDSARPQ